MFSGNLGLSVLVFVLAALAIAVVGTRLGGLADRLADVTGLGEAVVGALMLGGATSLPGIVAVVTAAVDNYPAMAFSAAVGGIAAQTCFLALADMTYRGANLEHAAASVPNLTSGALLISLLALPLLAVHLPEVAFFGVHPVSVLLVVGYSLGMQLVHKASEQPMWRPRLTTATREDRPDEVGSKHESMPQLIAGFAAGAAVVAVAGWAVAKSGEAIAAETGLSDSFVGGILLAVSTSLPELVTSVAAVRRGALTLAVGGIIGGNAFDTLFVAVGDAAYRGGSIYHHLSEREPALLSFTMLMTSILLLGMLLRERRGPGNIGFESVLILILYAITVVVLGADG